MNFEVVTKDYQNLLTIIHSNTTRNVLKLTKSILLQFVNIFTTICNSKVHIFIQSKYVS